MKYKKELLVILTVIIISVIGFFIYIYVDDFIKEKELKEKELMLQEHLDQHWWVFNNLEMSGQNIWHMPNISFPGFVQLTKTSFILSNNSPIDISSVTLNLDIYDAGGNVYLLKEVKFPTFIQFSTFIKANSINPIEEFFNDPEFKAIPQGFSWRSRLVRVEPDPLYIKSKTLEEIKKYVLEDSLSLRSRIQIDWEGLAKSLDSLNQEK